MKTECTKIPFSSREESEIELRRIVESNDYRDWKQKTPVRFYRCNVCEGEIWHLTSKPTITKYR